jgi:hypothetical protein
LLSVQWVQDVKTVSILIIWRFDLDRNSLNYEITYQRFRVIYIYPELYCLRGGFRDHIIFNGVRYIRIYTWPPAIPGWQSLRSSEVRGWHRRWK